jgi:hypothetical protein
MITRLSSLTWCSLIGLWEWVILRTCCALSNQCPQVNPAITTDTQGEISYMENHALYQFLQLLQQTQDSILRPLEELYKCHLLDLCNNRLLEVEGHSIKIYRPIAHL